MGLNLGPVQTDAESSEHWQQELARREALGLPRWPSKREKAFLSAYIEHFLKQGCPVPLAVLSLLLGLRKRAIKIHIDVLKKEGFLRAPYPSEPYLVIPLYTYEGYPVATPWESLDDSPRIAQLEERVRELEKRLPEKSGLEL